MEGRNGKCRIGSETRRYRREKSNDAGAGIMTQTAKAKARHHQGKIFNDAENDAQITPANRALRHLRHYTISIINIIYIGEYAALRA